MDSLQKVVMYFLLFYLIVLGASMPMNGELTREDFETRKSTYRDSPAPHKKPLKDQLPLVMNMLHESTIHGFLGDAEVPLYPNITSGSPSPTNKWRIVCKRESQVFVLVMNVEIEGRGSGRQEGEEYLQVRRKKIRGTNNKFYAYNFKLNSILVAYVNAPSMPSDCSPFRIAYMCIPTNFDTDVSKRVEEAELLLLNADILKYIETHPEALDDLDWLFQTKDYEYNFQNPGNHTTITDMRDIWIDSILKL